MKTYDERREAVTQKLRGMKAARKKRRRIIGCCSGVLTLAVLALILFLPYNDDLPEVSGYEDSPYYDVICQINRLTYTPPRYQNGFDALLQSLDRFAEGAMNAAPDAMPEGGESTGEYVEVTDNQVSGVTEADLFKRSGKYIYYLSGETLRIYSIAAEASALVGEYTLDFNNHGEDKEEYSYLNAAEMYLSTDGTVVTLVMDCYSHAIGSATVLLNLDVSDPEDIRSLDYVCFPGDTVSTRMVDGQLLLTYNFRVNRSSVDFEEPETFVPSYGKPGEMICIPADDIVCPDNATSARYTVVCTLDGKTLEVGGAVALLSYSTELYVSENAVFTTRTYTEKRDASREGYDSVTVTEITGVSYGAELKQLGSVVLDGSVKDQYSMDAYEGILRVVTSTNSQFVREYGNESVSSAVMSERNRNVNLYCVDLEHWEVVSAVEGFAPEGEEAVSVRFDGAAAYVCTAVVIELTDPVYFFDLTDVHNITWTDTGTIDGYSSSLIQLGDGFLMGIGFGDRSQLKIEIYEELDGAVVSAAVWEENASFPSDYKAYFIDRQQDLVGLMINDWATGECAYCLLHFDGYGLNEMLRLPVAYCDMNDVRACMIDGMLYILSENGIAVEDIN